MMSLFQQAVYHFSQLKGDMGENKSFPTIPAKWYTSPLYATILL